MSVAGVAAGNPLLPPGQRRAPAQAEPASTGFGRMLGERSALTSPTGDAAARHSRSAPLAVAFDRGELFGRSTAFQPYAQDLPSEGGGGRPGDRDAVVPNDGSVSLETARLELDMPASAAVRPERDAAPDARVDHRPAPLSLAVARPETGRSESRMPASAPPAQAPSFAPQQAKPQAGGDVAALARLDGRHPGAKLRQLALSNLGPVNVVVRAAQGGVQVTTRIGSLRLDEAPGLHEAVETALHEGGARLTELRFNGRTISRRDQCQ